MSNTCPRKLGSIPRPLSCTSSSAQGPSRVTHRDRAAGWRELQRVAHEVPEDLLDPHHVREDGRVLGFDGEGDLLRLRILAQRICDPLDDGPPLHRRTAQRQFSGLQPRKVQQVIDDLRLRVDGPTDGVGGP